MVTFQQTRASKNKQQPFELWSWIGANGIRIIWGVEPDSQGGKEATVQQKLAAIDGVIARFGQLMVESPGNKSPGRVFDVRSGQAVELPRDKVAALPEAKF